MKEGLESETSECKARGYLTVVQSENFQVGRNLKFELTNLMPITYTVLQPKLPTYPGLISCSIRQLSSGLGHSGLQSALRRSQPGRLGITVRLPVARPDSHRDWRCQMASSELVHGTARALIIEILLIRRHCK
jgi:hypothetical protein